MKKISRIKPYLVEITAVFVAVTMIASNHYMLTSMAIGCLFGLCVSYHQDLIKCKKMIVEAYDIILKQVSEKIKEEQQKE